MNGTTPELQELLDQGKVLYSLDQYEQALSYFEQARKLDPYCEATYENISMCHIMMDQYDQARKVLEQYLLLNKKSGTAHFHLGNIALLEGKAAEARSWYSKAELLGFTNPVMFLNLASFYEEAHETDKALEQYQKILRGNPYDYGAMEAKTNLLLRAKRYDEALRSAKTMVQTDIDQFEGHHLVYVSLILLNRNTEAGAYLEELLQRFPDNRTILFDQARFFDLSGQPERSLALLEQHFPNVEKDPRAALLKLGLLLQLKRTDEAMDLLEHSPSLQKEENALTMLYSMYFAKGDYARAIECCNRLQALGEDSSQYYAAAYFRPLAQKRLGKTELAEQDFAAAAELLREAARKRPAQVDLQMYRALCEYQLGHYDAAKRLIEYLLAVKNDVPAFHLAASAIFEALGDHAEASAHRETARRLDPNAVAPFL